MIENILITFLVISAILLGFGIVVLMIVYDNYLSSPDKTMKEAFKDVLNL